jgi:hypothetical protein
MPHLMTGGLNLEHATPDDWRAELKKQHITNFNSLNDMQWRYKDIQDAGKDLARSNRKVWE